MQGAGLQRGCQQEGGVEVRPRSDTQVMLPALPGRAEMPRQRELPFSWSCLKLFLDRENLQELSLGFGGGVKEGLLISRLCL